MSRMKRADKLTCGKLLYVDDGRDRPLLNLYNFSDFYTPDLNGSTFSRTIQHDY